MTLGYDRVRRLLGSENPEDQTLALIEIREHPSAYTVLDFFDLLSAPDSCVRAAAVEAASALAEAIRTEVCEAVVLRLSDPEELVRCSAIVAIGDLRFNSAREMIEGMLKDDASSIVRADAAEALASLGDPLAIPGLVTALSDEDPGVRAYAAISIGLLGTVEQLDTVRRALVKEGNAGVRGELHGACVRLGGSGSIEDLVRFIQDADDDVAWNALNIVQDLLERRAVLALARHSDLLTTILGSIAVRQPLARPQVERILTKLQDIAAMHRSTAEP